MAKNSYPLPLTVKKFIPGIAWFFVVLVLVCLPGSTLPTPENWLNAIYFDKWVHVGLFGGLGFLFMLPVTKCGWEKTEKLNCYIKITLAVSLWGLTVEFIQKYFVPGRSFDLYDWAADSLGAVLAFIFIRLRFSK